MRTEIPKMVPLCAIFFPFSCSQMKYSLLLTIFSLKFNSDEKGFHSDQFPVLHCYIHTYFPGFCQIQISPGNFTQMNES